MGEYKILAIVTRRIQSTKTRRRSRASAKLVLAVGGTLLALGLIELVLQVLAYNVWLGRHSGEARSEGDGPVVLCVGDSMTHGLGATSSSASYPAQLQRRLREADGKSWVVINGGWPGRDSRTVLDLLPDQLRRFKPDYVCVLVGVNDEWMRNGRAKTGSGDDSFPIVYRSWRSLSLLLAGRLDNYEEEAFIGEWHSEQISVKFEHGGNLWLEGAAFRWVQRAGKLIAFSSTKETVIEWRLDELGHLHLRTDSWDREFVLKRGPVENLSLSARIRADVKSRNWKSAVAAFDPHQCEALPIEEQAEIRGALVTSWVALKSPEKADEHLRWLIGVEQGMKARAPESRVVRESLVTALTGRHREADAHSVAVRLIEEHPSSLRGWAVLLQDDSDPAVPSLLLKASQDLPRTHPLRAMVFMRLGLLARDRDPAGFLSYAFSSLLAGAVEGRVIHLLYLNRSVLNREVLAAAIERLKPTASEEARIRGWFDLAVAEKADHSAILVDHLTRIVESCRVVGSHPLLLDYPFKDPRHKDLVDTVGVNMKAQRVEIRPRFAAKILRVQREGLFLKDDMHCNDAGYGLMAEVVAAALLK